MQKPMTDYSRPQRMGAAAFFIFFIKSLKTIFGAVALYAIIKLIGSDSSLGGMEALLRIVAGIGAIVALSLLLAFAAYWPRKFCVEGSKLLFSSGLIKRQTTTVPLDRIHSLRTRRGVWYRLMGMRGIVFDTLATKGEEIELILPETDWQNLLRLIESGERFAVDNDEVMTNDSSPKPPLFNPIETIRFDNRQLFLDALCQNHLKGFAILGSFLVAIYNAIEEITDHSVDKIVDYTEAHCDAMSLTPFGIVTALAIVYITVLFLWLGMVMLRYSDMKLVYDRRVLSFSYGLLSRASCRFDCGKVCTVWVKRNFLEKRSGLCALRLKQALFASASKEEDNLKLYGPDRSEFFLDWWLGADWNSQTVIASARSGRGVILRALLPWVVLSVGATIIFCCNGAYAGSLLAILCVVIASFCGWQRMRRSRIILRDSYLQIDNGCLSDVRNYLKYENVEVVRLRRTPFSRLSGRVELSLSTSGSSFNVRSLSESDALGIRELILKRVM